MIYLGRCLIGSRPLVGFAVTAALLSACIDPVEGREFGALLKNPCNRPIQLVLVNTTRLPADSTPFALLPGSSVWVPSAFTEIPFKKSFGAKVLPIGSIFQVSNQDWIPTSQDQSVAKTKNVVSIPPSLCPEKVSGSGGGD